MKIYIKYTSLIIKILKNKYNKHNFYILLYKMDNTIENTIENSSFLDDNDISDYDIMDINIIKSLNNICYDITINNIDILLDNIFYQKSILSDREFNRLLYDISNNNIKNIDELVDYHIKLMCYIKKNM